MSEQSEIVTINGRAYDKHSGMPITPHAAKPASSVAEHHSAGAVHQHAHKSETLNRRYVKKPEHLKAASQKIVVGQDTTHPMISKFAPSQPAHKPKRVADIAPGVHPMVQRVHAARAQANESRVPKPSTILKQEAVDSALANASTPSGHHRPKGRSVASRRAQLNRRFTLVTGGIAVLLIGAYFTYISMPAISVRVAAAQAGVNASYPAYRPNGYSLAGSVAYQPGSVSMKFTQNGGHDSFTLTQANSGWDSGALLNNYVQPKAGTNYAAAQDNGLTIYTFDSNAAWVSGGILYTIQGDAPLSAQQVQSIATSL